MSLRISKIALAVKKYPRLYPQAFDIRPKLCDTVKPKLSDSFSLPPSLVQKIVTHSLSDPFKILLVCALLAGTSLSGCSWPGDPVGIDEQAGTLEKDIGNLYGEQEPITAPLGLYDAMARGIKYNIAHRVSRMEEVLANGAVDVSALGMLPGLDLEAGYFGRNAAEAISARSKVTGDQSLTSSIFQDEHRRTANLDLSWNVLDAGMAYVQSRQASDKARAALERRRKVVQNIAQDIRHAYWRAASAEILGNRINGLVAQADGVLKKLEEEENSKSTRDVAALLNLEKRLYDSLQDLLDERDKLATARADLAALIGVAPSTPFTLAGNEADMMAANALPTLSTSREDLEVLALLIRPEMREHTLLKRVAERGSTQTVLEAFPGIGGIVGYNYDSNSFLDDESWASFSLSLTQSLMNLFALPVRLQHAENKEKLADLQRMTMVATVLTQMSVADTRYGMASDRYALLKRMMGVNARLITAIRQKQDRGAYAEGLLLAAEMDQLLTRTRLHGAFAEGQNAFGRLVSTLGLDPLPPGIEDKEVAEMAEVIRSRYQTLDGEVIATLLAKLRERTNLLSRDGVILPLLRPTIQPASAQAGVEKEDSDHPI